MDNWACSLQKMEDLIDGPVTDAHNMCNATWPHVSRHVSKLLFHRLQDVSMIAWHDVWEGKEQLLVSLSWYISTGLFGLFVPTPLLQN